MRLILQGNIAWLNGEPYSLTEQQRPLVQLLARQRCYTREALDAVLQPAGSELLHDWIEQGYFAQL